jgi:hypothetical protein
MKHHLWLLPLLAIPAVSAAQTPRPDWAVGLYGFADNREYKPEQHQIDRTIIGTWLAPELGLRFDSVHHLRVGLSLLREFGNTAQHIKDYQYTAYYLMDARPFTFYFGSFPSRQLLADYPDAMRYDSIAYYRQNMEGVFWRIHLPRTRIDVWLDWMGMQSPAQRENFKVGIAAMHQKKWLFAAAQTYMNHYALTSNSDTSEHICDNLMAHLAVGFDLQNKTALDSLKLSLGAVINASRERHVTDLIPRSGLLIELQIEKLGLGIKNTLYQGQSQLPLFAKHGNSFYWSDPFYQNSFYNRTDFYLRLIDTERVQACFAYGLHYAASVLSHQQRFTLCVSLDPTRKSAKPRRKTIAGLLAGKNTAP